MLSHLQTPEDLVDEKLHVLVGECLLPDDVVQVGAHQVHHQVAARGEGRGGEGRGGEQVAGSSL